MIAAARGAVVVAVWCAVDGFAVTASVAMIVSARAAKKGSWTKGTLARHSIIRSLV